MLKITPEEIKSITKYIHAVSGIYLDNSKRYLLETRLSPIAEELGCSNYLELQRRAQNDGSRRIEKKIIDAISTNETLFFRDSGPFQLLQHKLVPELIDRRSAKATYMKPTIRIWSAAASTGQELYSIAIVLKELLGDTRKYSLKLLGTDISDSAIAQASRGRYSKFEIERGLSRDKLNKYFTLAGGYWQVKDEIRAMVTFRRLNLMLPFRGLGQFDIIFCRNVAIYFTLEDRKKLFNRLAEVLEPDGALIIGATESLTGISRRFVPQRYLRSLYYTLK